MAGSATVGDGPTLTQELRQAVRWQASYLLLIILTLILLAAVLAYGWRFRYARGAKHLLAFGVGALVWTLLVGLTSVSPPEVARLWLLAKYFVIAFEPLPVLLFVLTYTGRERWIRPWVIAAAAIVPVITQAMVWTNESHHLMLRVLDLVEEEGFTYLRDIQFGPWYWVHALHGYLTILLSAGIMGLGLIRASPLVRRQGVAIFAGVLAPLVANVTLITGIAPREIDPMPFGLALTGVLFAWGGFGQRLLDLAPIARSALVDAVREGMLVRDGEGRIIDLNPPMAEVLGVDGVRAVGRPCTEFLGGASRNWRGC